MLGFRPLAARCAARSTSATVGPDSITGEDARVNTEIRCCVAF
jgi:hypothetical protein